MTFYNVAMISASEDVNVTEEDWAEHGIRVNAIVPVVMRTEIGG